MSLMTILAILFIHWIADFCLQTEWQASNKSKNNEALLRHTANYSLVWMVVGTVLMGINSDSYPQWSVSIFTAITFMAHTITDYFTSRLNAKLWAKKDFHNFFVSVGFDQFLHFTQLLVTYKLLM